MCGPISVDLLLAYYAWAVSQTAFHALGVKQQQHQNCRPLRQFNTKITKFHGIYVSGRLEIRIKLFSEILK